MAYSRWSIDYDMFKDLENQLKELGEGLDDAVINALYQTGQYVTKETQKAISSSPHNFNRTGDTKKLLVKDPKVSVARLRGGLQAWVNTGFRLRDDGGEVLSLTPIYLMYGTNARKGKGVSPDSNLKNAVKGEGLHRDKINKIQREEFNKVISKVMEKRK